jgi:large-conductance mechanosensitive channel
MSGTAWGFAVVTGIVLIAVIVYTVIKLRKQVHKREQEEQKKNKLN